MLAQHKFGRSRLGQASVEYALILGAVAISLMVIYGSIGHHEAGLVTAASGALSQANAATAGNLEVDWGSEKPASTDFNIRKRLKANACKEKSALDDAACRGKAMVRDVSESLADMRLPDIRLVATGYTLLQRMYLLPREEALDVGVVPLAPESSPPQVIMPAQSAAAMHSRTSR
jgi:Flp pilus assembly pilin Flp